MPKIVAYYRVSTTAQGKSGLGIEAQQAAVAAYLARAQDWTVVASIVEVETGKRNDRPELARALALCRLHRCALIVSKVDRLARSLSFLLTIIDSGVDVRFADLPAIEGATGRFLLQQMAAVAELEAGMISARTKDALMAAKARGVKIGGDRGYRQPKASSAHARAVKSGYANDRANDVLPTIRELQSKGIVSLPKLANALIEMGIPTARGGNNWTPMGVSRVLARAA